MTVSLLPKIGPRARFMAKLSELRKSMENDEVTSGSVNTPARILQQTKLDAVMLHCFYCQANCNGWHNLITHFRYSHKLTMLNNVVCGQQSCQQDFQSLKSLRRHILAAHMNSTDSVDCEVTCQYGGSDTEVHADVLDCEIPFVGEENIDDDVDVDTFFDERGINLAAAAFIAKLKSHATIPASVVNDILNDVEEFFSSGCIKLLHKKTHRVLQMFNIELTDCRVQDLLQNFEKLGDIFNGLKTEYQQMKYFEQSGLYIAPESIVVGHRLDTSVKNDVTTIAPTNVTAQHVPLYKIFQAFFQLPGVIAITKQYLRDTDQHSEAVHDFIHGTLWNSYSVEQTDTELFVPYMLYFDDFETANPLGSRKGVHKLGAVYACLKCFPSRYNSQLKNLFLTLLFYSQDRVTFGDEVVFRTLVEEVKLLMHTGINLTVGNIEYHIKFVMVQILGDNLGLNSILGFTESFSANHYCRNCRIHKHNTSKLFVEDPTLLRNIENYAVDVSADSVSDTGIKHSVIWNEIDGYHVTNNWAFDIMHDMLEGVCNYDMQNVINYILNKRKFITLHALNSRIQAFDYGLDEGGNKPPVVTQSILSLESLNMKAIEMLRLVQNFSVIVGDVVPEGDDVWQFYLVLRQILDIILASSITDSELKLLKLLVTEHHQLYVQLFGESLKPKHHFMVHYAHATQIIGPLRWVWGMRFESKHGQAKKTAHVICNFRNICRSLAVKHQLKVCYRLFANESLCDELVVGTGSVIDVEEDSCNNVAMRLYSCGVSGHLFHAKWVKLNGITYRPGQALMTGIINDMPHFATVVGIFVDEDRSVHFVTSELTTVSFCAHLHAYIVSETSQQLQCHEASSLLDHRPLRCRTSPYTDSTDHVITLHCAL